MITITAQSSNNVTVTSFVGPVNLAATGQPGPVAISPPRSAWFINGVWTGSLTVLQIASNVVVTATDGASHSGSSNPFDVATHLFKFTNFNRDQNGQVQLTISGKAGEVYRVLASPDLLGWQTIAFITNVTGVVQFTDPDPMVYDHRFYRCVTP